MLTEFQRRKVWESLLAAETRALYFADLASRRTVYKQVLTAASFFLSSGAAAVLIAKGPSWLVLVPAIIVALINAFSIAWSLDRSIATFAKLHGQWAQIGTAYERLWSHLDDADAEQQLDAIKSREKEPSELAATDAPNDQKRLGRWQERVFSLYHLTDQHV